MTIIWSFLWIVGSFFSGAIPFSVLVGRLALRTDIRQYGDGNPGGTNVARAGGKAWGALAIFLDMLKGGVPVGLAWYFGGVSGWVLVAVCLAPLLGHGYSPFLGFRGGKSIAVAGGVWGGLSFGAATGVMALLLVLWYALLTVDGWAVIAALLSFGALMTVIPAFGWAVPGTFSVWLAVWVGTLLILGWKHRFDLGQKPGLRAWIGQRLGRG